MSQSRRDRFEEQLRALQNDISNLSQKLAIPVAPDEHRPGQQTIIESKDTSRISAKSISFGPSIAPDSTAELLQDDFGGTEKGFILKLKRDVQNVSRERDEALYKLEQANREIEILKNAIRETNKLPVQYDHLKQEYESLKISFESSERIRKQQKELISLLQRSHNIADSTMSVGSGHSLSSLNGRETLSTQPYSPSIAAENRSWLNSYSVHSRDDISDIDGNSLGSAPVAPFPAMGREVPRESGLGTGIERTQSVLDGSGVSTVSLRKKRLSKGKKSSGSSRASGSGSGSRSVVDSGSGMGSSNGVAMPAVENHHHHQSYLDPAATIRSRNGVASGGSRTGYSVDTSSTVNGGRRDASGSHIEASPSLIPAHPRRVVVSSSTPRSMTTAPKAQPSAHKRHALLSQTGSHGGASGTIGMTAAASGGGGSGNGGGGGGSSARPAPRSHSPGSHRHNAMENGTHYQDNVMGTRGRGQRLGDASNISQAYFQEAEVGGRPHSGRPPRYPKSTGSNDISRLPSYDDPEMAGGSSDRSDRHQRHHDRSVHGSDGGLGDGHDTGGFFREGTNGHSSNFGPVSDRSGRFVAGRAPVATIRTNSTNRASRASSGSGSGSGSGSAIGRRPASAPAGRATRSKSVDPQRR